MAIQYEKIGGLEAYREALWLRIAFGARYGHQSIDTLLNHHSADLENFNDALGRLIKGENSTGNQ
jgi:hypothetical protein